ncbi:unnamed protein product [Arabidopsis halleri]
MSQETNRVIYSSSTNEEGVALTQVRLTEVVLVASSTNLAPCCWKQTNCRHY